MIDLVLFAPGLEGWRALRDDATGYARAHGLDLGPHRDLLARLAADALGGEAPRRGQAPWDGRLALDPRTRRVLGTCSFKGPPDLTGAVEIAYLTLPGGEGRGIATAMVRGLLAIAASAPQPPTVRAHTKPVAGASARVLRKAGFACLGPVIEPDHGRVWRWERDPRPAGGPGPGG